MRVGLTIPKKLLKWRPPFTLKGLALASGEWIEFLGITWHLWETKKHSSQAWTERVCCEGAGCQQSQMSNWSWTSVSESHQAPLSSLLPPSPLLRLGSQTNSLFRNGNGVYSSCAVFRYKELMQSPHLNFTILLKSHAHTSANQQWHPLVTVWPVHYHKRMLAKRK